MLKYFALIFTLLVTPAAAFPTDIQIDLNGNISFPASGLIVGLNLGSSAFLRPDAQLQVGMPGSAYPQGFINFVDATYPGSISTESGGIFTAYNASGLPGKRGSISYKWWNFIPGNEAGVLRLNATWASGLGEDVVERIFGHGGTTFCDTSGTADINAPGYGIVKNYCKLIMANDIQVANDTTGAGTVTGFGTNSPAVTLTQPYTWLKFISSDGSTVWVPAYK